MAILTKVYYLTAKNVVKQVRSLRQCFRPAWQRFRQTRDIPAASTYLILAALAAFTITACLPNSQIESSSTRSVDTGCHPIQHTMGESCVPRSPERIITLTPSALGNLVALGIQPVGTATYESYTGLNVQPYLQDKVGEIDWVGSGSQPSLEKIAQLKPDVILGLDKLHRQVYPQLSQIAPTVLLDTSDRSAWKQLFRDVAAVVEKTPKAEQMLRDYSGRVDELREQLGEKGLQKTVSIAYVMGNDIYLEAKNSFAGSILEEVGIRRPSSQAVVSPDNGRLILSQERIDSIDGDVLLIPKSGNELDQDQEAFMQQPIWQTLQVVQREQVYRVNLWEWTGRDFFAAHEILNDLFQYLVKEAAP